LKGDLSVTYCQVKCRMREGWKLLIRVPERQYEALRGVFRLGLGWQVRGRWLPQLALMQICLDKGIRSKAAFYFATEPDLLSLTGTAYYQWLRAMLPLPQKGRC
jgi:hypothetical protein